MMRYKVFLIYLHSGVALGNSEQQDHIDNCDADDGQGRNYRSLIKGFSYSSGPGEVLKGEIRS